jgi:hypothetical protein
MFFERVVMNMSYKHAIVIIALLFIGASAPAQGQGENASDLSAQPEKLIISLGRGVYTPSGGRPEAMFGFSYSVELRGKDLRYSAVRAPSKPNVERVVTPTKEQWEAFWKEVEKAKVWEWSGNYYNHDVTDGTIWLVEISYRGRSIKVNGSNSYPSEGDVSKSNRSPEYSPPFETLLQGVRNLLGGLELR